MNRPSTARFVSVPLAALAICAGAASDSSAQAWVPPQGEGAVTITYQNYYIEGHFDRAGRKTPNGATHSKSVFVELNYGLMDSLGLAISLPFVSSKYTGPRPSYFVGPFETFPGPLDDGTYHGAFQDVRIELRRSFGMGLLAVAPFVGGTWPTHDYETVGEAVPGRHRPELQVGANAGALLDSVLPGGYVHVRYWYTAAQRLQNLPYRRSNVEIEGGCSVMTRVSVRGVASWQFAHDAPTLAQLAPIWRIHDRFIVPNYTNLGGGVSFELTRSVEIHALWVGTVSGIGGAHIARMLSVGATWSFGGGLDALTSAPSRSNPRAGESGK